jgi:lactate dehydrogenase-like 2-hydroxyacid dehydrogenase
LAKHKIVSLLPPKGGTPLGERLALAVDMSSVELVELGKKAAAEEEICEACRGATIIMGDYSAENYISRRVLEAAEGVRHVQFGSKGFGGVDLKAATEMGVTVSNGFGDGVNVAEHTMMLILSLLRHTVHAHTSMKREEWRQWEIIRGTRPLRGMTLGILGLGTIGREVAKRAPARVRHPLPSPAPRRGDPRADREAGDRTDEGGRHPDQHCQGGARGRGGAD